MYVYTGRDDYSAPFVKARTTATYVSIFVDEHEAGAVKTGLFLCRDVHPGPHTLRAKIEGLGAGCPDLNVSFEARDGKSLFFQIDIETKMILLGLLTIPHVSWEIRPVPFSEAFVAIGPCRLALDVPPRNRESVIRSGVVGSFPAVFLNGEDEFDTANDVPSPAFRR